MARTDRYRKDVMSKGDLIKLLARFSLILFAMPGCKPSGSDNLEPAAQPAMAPRPTTTPSSAALAKAIRIDAGSTKPFVDADGYTWKPDGGFSGGGMVDRGNIQIANTRNPGMYRTEHWGMNLFTTPVANGHYTVLLHF